MYAITKILWQDLDCWRPIKLHTGVQSTLKDSYFSPVEGLLPYCAPESTVMNQLTV